MPRSTGHLCEITVDLPPLVPPYLEGPKCHTQEVFDGSHLSGKKEGSQTRVRGRVSKTRKHHQHAWERSRIAGEPFGPLCCIFYLS